MSKGLGEREISVTGKVMAGEGNVSECDGVLFVAGYFFAGVSRAPGLMGVMAGK